MRRTLLFIFWIWLNSGINDVLTQENACVTPDQKRGLCININDCPVLLNLLLNQSRNPQVRNFLRSSGCGFEGRTPKVCCVQVTERIVESTTANIPTERIIVESTTNIPTESENNSTSGSINSSKLPKTPNCGFSNVTTPRIVNGIPAKLGEFPWMVALGYRNSKNPQMPKWLCGGSLITNKHILTAAHCVYNRADLYVARVGDLDLYSNDDGASPETIPLAKAKIHEDYSPTTFSSDIAILTLEKAPTTSTVWPICLPVIEPYRSMSYLNFNPTLAGWGTVSFKGPSSTFLQEIFVPVMNNEACERVFGRRATIDNRIICAGSTNGDKDACGGDSGGPLMNVISEDKHYRVYEIGIVSYGFKCAEPGYPGVYTRVTAFIDWIEKNVE